MWTAARSLCVALLVTAILTCLFVAIIRPITVRNLVDTLETNEELGISGKIGNDISRLLFRAHLADLRCNNPLQGHPIIDVRRATCDNQLRDHLRKDSSLAQPRDMIHETRGVFCFQSREFARKMFGLDVVSRQDHVAHIHLRCSDVPCVNHDAYKFIAYEWYLAALKLLPAAFRTVVLRSCIFHPDFPEGTSCTPTCENYASGLRDYLAKSGYETTIDWSCGTSPSSDFESLCESHAIINGGCGGSFGFWACVLSPETSYGIVPGCEHSLLNLEIGVRSLQKLGERKWMLNAPRVPHQVDYRDHSAISIACHTTKTTTVPRYDRVAIYINRQVDSTRRSHMEEELASNGFVASRLEPIANDDIEISLIDSHKRALRLATNRATWTLICEDDTEFHLEDSATRVADFCDTCHLFGYVGLCLPGNMQQATAVDYGLYRGRCSHAYVVSPDGAKALLRALGNDAHIIDVTLEQFVLAPVLRPDLHSKDIAGHIGLAFQNRTAPWYHTARN